MLMLQPRFRSSPSRLNTLLHVGSRGNAWLPTGVRFTPRLGQETSVQIDRSIQPYIQRVPGISPGSRAAEASYPLTSTWERVYEWLGLNLYSLQMTSTRTNLPHPQTHAGMILYTKQDNSLTAFRIYYSPIKRSEAILCDLLTAWGPRWHSV